MLRSDALLPALRGEGQRWRAMLCCAMLHSAVRGAKQSGTAQPCCCCCRTTHHNATQCNVTACTVLRCATNCTSTCAALHCATTCGVLHCAALSCGICAIVVGNSKWCLSALPLHAMPTACSSRWLCDPSAAIGKAKGASSRAKMPRPLAAPTA